ncbi:unnamed protein product [Adineta steineri]|uniref:Chitin-binding type-2 domain-containing protein n=1 Tax=Adineta steineri TaxID=433720 RepID=A0A814JU33_9BILA|nr:unnamed protein product [Adineta steineri]
MQLLNHHQKPCNTFSFGLAIIILADFFFESILAEYDCSAKDDGWFYDPEFCHIYWRCIHGTSEEFECASGTAWDHHDNRCNWLDSVDCSRAEKTTAKAISSEEDPQDYPVGNSDENNDRPTVVKKKKSRKINPKKKKLPNSKEDDPNGDDRELSILYIIFLLIIFQTKSSTDFLCAGGDGFFAHPEYCTRYYRCSHGIDEMFECPKGTAWDEITKSCAWVDEVNCDKKKLGYSTNTTTSRKTSDTNSVSSNRKIVSTISIVDGKDENKGSPAIECQPTGIYSLADPNECNNYYQCDKGIRTKITCPDNTLYDTEKYECKESERVNCGARSLSLSNKNQCKNFFLFIHIKRDSNHTTVGIGKRDGIYPDIERDCHFYFQCVTQKKTREAKCADDQKFSSYTTKCGPTGNAPAPCGSFIAGNSATKIIKQPNSIRNSSYYQSTTLPTTKLSQSLITKPNSYLYNPNDDDDDDDILLNRIKRDSTPFVCKADGYYPDRQNCRIYHICTSGVDTAAVCGEGTVWDPAKKICGWADTIQCKKGLRKWNEITDIRGVTLFVTDPNVGWRGKRNTTTTRPPIKVDSNFSCEYDAEGNFPDPKYCHIYHRCGIGFHIVQECGTNLWYSTISEGCDWPEKSDCKAGHFNTSSTTATDTNGGTDKPPTDSKQPHPPIECPRDAQGHFVQGHFPDPYDCSVYHYCNGGVDKIAYCDPGLFWDKKHGCQWPKDVPNCQHKCPVDGQRIHLVDTSSCCHYYECINGHLKTQVCPLHKLYSVASKRCENFQVVTCGSRKNCIDPCDYDYSPLCPFHPVCRGMPNGNYIDEYRPHCRWHYTCLEDRTFNYTACDEGLRYSIQHQRYFLYHHIL